MPKQSKLLIHKFSLPKRNGVMFIPTDDLTSACTLKLLDSRQSVCHKTNLPEGMVKDGHQLLPLAHHALIDLLLLSQHPHHLAYARNFKMAA